MLSLASLQKIKNIRPGNIYVENIRSVFDITRIEARTFCEMAVSNRLFEKRIGFYCPSPTCNQRIIADFSLGESIPKEILCDQCELNGFENYLYETSKLKRVEFYRLRKH